MIELPGWTPRSPVKVVGPVLVTVEAPSTTKACAVPRTRAADAGKVSETKERARERTRNRADHFDGENFGGFFMGCAPMSWRFDGLMCASSARGLSSTCVAPARVH